MTPQPPRELLVSERPVRSTYARERSYARRRVATLAVVGIVIVAMIYGMWGRSSSNPADIPTIQGISGFKQKPADPGGIDIPHQDVQVYGELEGKSAPKSQIEHLLPPPEVPRDLPHAGVAGNVMESVVPPSAPRMQPPPVPPPVSKTDIVLSEPAPPPIATTVGLAPAVPEPVAPAVMPAPVPSAAAEPSPAPQPVPETAHVQKTAPAPAPKSATGMPQPLTIEQVINQTAPPKVAEASESSANAPAPAPQAQASVSSGSYAVQLASSPEEDKAQAMMKNLQHKYSAQLGGAVLGLSRAYLGDRGTFYRIQSQGLAQDQANQICSALKQINAGCILVRK